MKVKTWIGVIVVLALLLVFSAMSFYVVNPSEVGVIKRFGVIVATTTSGLHMRVPFIDKVYKPSISEVKRLEVGYRNVAEDSVKFENVKEEAIMLTGDNNILNVSIMVQYRIKDPVTYLFKVDDHDTAFRYATESAIRQVIATNPIDAALTDKKSAIQEDVKVLLKKIVDENSLGVDIINVQLQDVHPPDEVLAAFKDVSSAMEDKNTKINNAEAYGSKVIPEAEGNALRIIKEAEAYKSERIAKAQGDANYYQKNLKEYQRSRDVTKKRLYIETMTRVLANVPKYIVSSGVNFNMYNVNGNLFNK